MNDFSLVIFTVLVQAAVGMYGILALLRLAARGAAAVDVLVLDKAMLYVWPIFAVGMIASATHLGQPFNGPNFVRGLFHGSPLSIEVATCIAFAATGVGYGFVAITGRLSSLKFPLLVLSIILAVGVVIAMTRLYFLAAVPAWNNIWTPIQFTLTVLSLGLTGVMILPRAVQGERRFPAQDWLPLVAILAIAALLASVPGYQAWFAGLSPGPNFDALPAYVAQLYALRLAAIAAALAVAVWAAVRRAPRAPVWYTLVFALLLAGELMGRIIFFELRSSTGL